MALKEQSFYIKICDKIIKYCLYAAIFLIPLFFLPFTADALDFNKQALLVLLSFIALFAWMAKTLITGHISVNGNKVTIGLAVLVLVYAASNIFSVWRYGSFWGMWQITSESLLSLLALFIFYFLASSFFQKKEIYTSLVLLFISVLIGQVYGVLQLFGIFIIPFAFAKSVFFNTFGQTGMLGFVSAVLLPCAIALLIASKKWARLLAILEMVVAAVIFVLVNYNFVWWTVLAGSVILLILAIAKRDQFDARWMALPIFFLAISLFFIVMHPQINWLPRGNAEIFPSQKASFDLGLKILKSSPILGSGPGTFAYDYAKFRTPDYNLGLLWSVNFSAAASKILTVLASTGILGFLAWLVVIFLAVFYGLNSFLFRRKENEDNQPAQEIIIAGISSSLIAQVVGYFLYVSNTSSDFLLFFLFLAAAVLAFGEVKKYVLKPSSYLTLGITFVFTIGLIFGLGILFLQGQRYLADTAYAKGISLLQSGKTNDGISQLEKAAKMNSSSDLYFRQLSQGYFLAMQDLSSNTSISQADKQKAAQVLVSNAINAAKIATDINPSNVDNWNARAAVYQNFAGVIPNTEDWAQKMYDQALVLSPNNPYFYLQKGNVYFLQAMNLKEGEQNKKPQLLASSKEMYNKAIALKPDYSVAYFQLALIANAQEDVQAEKQALENADKYSAADAQMALQIGLFYYQNQDWQNAGAEFQRALSVVPNYANALYYLGLVYEKLGQEDNAIKVFSALQKTNPDNSNIKKILSNLNSGLPALSGLTQQPPSPNPSTTAPEQTGTLPASSPTATPKTEKK